MIKDAVFASKLYPIKATALGEKHDSDYYHSYVCCLFVVLVKLSVLAK